MVARVARVEAVVCDSAHEAAWLERNLLRAHLPPWNRSPSGGQEKEVWIRLSESARASGLRSVHRPSAPASARRRVRPLPGRTAGAPGGPDCPGCCRSAYAGGELSGTRHEMARALGVTGAERDELVADGGGGPRPRPGRGRAGARAPVRPPRRGGGRARVRVRGPAATGDRGTGLGNGRAEGHQAAPDDVDVCGWADGTLVRFRSGRAAVGLVRRAAATPRPPAAPGRHPARVDRIRPAQRRTRGPAGRLRRAPAAPSRKIKFIRMNERVVPDPVTGSRPRAQRKGCFADRLAFTL